MRRRSHNRCNFIIRRPGKNPTRCTRDVAEKLGCKDFCWQHAEEYKKGVLCRDGRGRSPSYRSSPNRRGSPPRYDVGAPPPFYESPLPPYSPPLGPPPGSPRRGSLVPPTPLPPPTPIGSPIRRGSVGSPIRRGSVGSPAQKAVSPRRKMGPSPYNDNRAFSSAVIPSPDRISPYNDDRAFSSAVRPSRNRNYGDAARINKDRYKLLQNLYIECKQEREDLATLMDKARKDIMKNAHSKVECRTELERLKKEYKERSDALTNAEQDCLKELRELRESHNNITKRLSECELKSDDQGIVNQLQEENNRLKSQLQNEYDAHTAKQAEYETIIKQYQSVNKDKKLSYNLEDCEKTLNLRNKTIDSYNRIIEDHKVTINRLNKQIENEKNKTSQNNFETKYPETGELDRLQRENKHLQGLLTLLEDHYAIQGRQVESLKKTLADMNSNQNVLLDKESIEKSKVDKKSMEKRMHRAHKRALDYETANALA